MQELQRQLLSPVTMRVIKNQRLNNPKHSVPLIISICTLLMSRVHRHVQQSRELIFCDSTSSLDRFNVSLFVLSKAHPAGGLHLGVLIISDEKETTIKNGLRKVNTNTTKSCLLWQWTKRRSNFGS